MDDALDSVVEMGGTVVRTFAALSVGCPKCIQPTLGTFNETALTKLDYVVKACKDRGLRVVLPLVDSASPSSPFYFGGTKTYTDWRSLANADAFYTDATAINDYKLHINTILTRVNTLTGVAYRDEPAIGGWETGNEMHTIGATFPTTTWTTTIANYIKSIDPKHLLIDGEYTSNTTINTAATGIAALDIFSNHHYPMDATKLNNDIFRVVNTAGRVFYVGEYNWKSTSPDSLSTFLSAIESGAVAGDSPWSLFPHRDDKGYVAHADGFTFYYPGLDSSPGSSGQRTKVAALRAHAYAMRGISVPADGIPKTPMVTSVTGSAGAGVVAWRGAAIADTYTIERATAGSGGPFTVICNQCVTDNPGTYTDTGAVSGNSWYRIKGHNLSSVAGPYSAVFAATL